MQPVSLARLREAGLFLASHGFPRQDRRRVTTWAILAAHAAQPSTHWAAQANARRLLEEEDPEKAGIHDHHPCVHFGEPGPRRWYVDGGRLPSLGLFRPACLDHRTDYHACKPECLYGVLMEGKWVHELLKPTAKPFRAKAPATRKTPEINDSPSLSEQSTDDRWNVVVIAVVVIAALALAALVVWIMLGWILALGATVALVALLKWLFGPTMIPTYARKRR